MKILKFASVLLTVMIIIAAFAIHYKQRADKNSLTLLLHGDKTLKLSGIVIDGYLSGTPVSAKITNDLDLDYLSRCFRSSESNSFKAGRFFTGKTWISGHAPTDAYFEIPDDLSYLIVFEPSFLDIRDPQTFLVPLESPIPQGLRKSLGQLIPPSAGSP
jgi:hypothetical protein